MKRITKTPKTVVVEEIETITEEPTNFEYMLGKKVVFICSSYTYTGTCTGVNSTVFEISEPFIIYETGPWLDDKWKDAQRLPADKITIGVNQYESCFVLNKDKS
jgi:hypothetical protein